MRTHGTERSPVVLGGFTLVEIMLALLIAVLLAAVLYMLFHTVVTSGARQQTRHEQVDPVQATIDRMTADLTVAFFPDDDACEVHLAPHELLPADFDEVAFCATPPSSAEDDPDWAEAIHIAYRVDVPAKADARLLRESQPLTGPDADHPETNLLLSAITRFKLEFYDGTNWLSRWSDEQQGAPPLAARMEVQTEHLEDPIQTDIFIPAGNVTRRTIPLATAP